MKNLLLVVNCILGIAVFAMFVSNVASLDSKKENYEVKKRSGSKNSVRQTRVNRNVKNTIDVNFFTFYAKETN